ncbi:MAG: hypothetical protein OEY20_03285 [Gemmatimonadota bacterium]|nr:hypothetical protein [Gemmatimonadota bacterium]
MALVPGRSSRYSANAQRTVALGANCKGETMGEKIRLEESELPPSCPHCKTSLRKIHWHKVQGGPGLVNYIVLMSCPHCRNVLGTLGS